MTRPHLVLPCKILCRSESAPRRYHALGKKYFADDVAPLEYTCMRCGLVWGDIGHKDCDVVLSDFQEVVCSACYSERVLLTHVRLSFDNWGDWNGGETEQRGRYHAAAKAIRKIKKEIKS